MRNFLFILVSLLALGCSPLNEPKTRNQVPLCGVDKQSLADEPEFRMKSLFNSFETSYTTPTKEIESSKIPFFEDDLEFEGMRTAIDRQLIRWNSRPPEGDIEIGGKVYPIENAVKSLVIMGDLIDEYKACRDQNNAKVTCLTTFNQSVRELFVVVQPDLKPGDARYGEPKPTLFTGYYTPLLEGTTEPTAENKHPIFLKPPQKFVATPRVDIDFNSAFAGLGLEIIYINELFAQYLLHVQGSGKASIKTANGTREFYMGYAGTNGLTWNFISKHMIAKGYIQDGSIQSQRTYLNQNPSRHKEIFETCPSYVYFLRQQEPPKGSGNVSVTPGRSIATDRFHYRFKGLLTYVEAARPVEETPRDVLCQNTEFQNFSRFFLDQDTGGAIRGKARVDIYFGEDQYAEIAAFNTVQRGDLYYLMLK